jgi:hypothetical protein
MYLQFDSSSNALDLNSGGCRFRSQLGHQSSKLMLALVSTVLLLSGPVRTHDHIFVLSRLVRVFKWGLLFDERRGLTSTGPSCIGE